MRTETEAYGTVVARKIDYVWDPDAQLNRPLSVTVEGESRTSYTYNAQNRLASVTRTNLTGVGMPNQALTTTYAYTLYGDGMVETMTVTQPSPNGSDHTTYQYDTHGNLTSVTDGLGHVTTYSSYNGLGEVGKVVGPNGDETDYTYDARGRVASNTTHPNGTTATWTYAYDGFGLLAKETASDGEITTWNRDAEKRVKTITHNDKDGTSTESFGYDANSDVISDVVERGSDIGKATTYAYDGLGRVYQVKGSNGQVSTYAYDGNGNVLSLTDALGHQTTYTYDALNRLEGTMDAAGGVTSYAYDADDHIIRVTDPRGLVTSYTWDGLGQLWQQVSPNSGTTRFGYDTYGRLASKTWPDGTLNSYSYDALNRPISISTGDQIRQFGYDTCPNGKSRLCATTTSIAGTHTAIDYSYTPEGWITGRSFASNGANYSLGYFYDDMGHLLEVSYPDSNAVIYDYANGAVADVRFKIGASSFFYGVTGITYRPMDLAMSNWTSYNGLTNSIIYDSDLRPTSISVPGVESMAFTYDAANRITQITNGTNASLSQVLTYDALNRLTKEAAGSWNESYTYDADGNRTYQVVNGQATSFVYSAGSNRLVSTSGGAGIATAYGYNAEGDMETIDGRSAFVHDAFERLFSASGTDFVTSADGQRLEKTSAYGTTYFAPDASGALWADDQDGTWKDYVWLNGRMVAMITNGGVYSMHDDQTGRTLAITDPNSHAIDWEAEGLPFDRNTISGSPAFFRPGLPGQYWDAEDGLWHNGARDYNPWLGRYIESDPIGLAGGVNTYSYVGGNPISVVDPTGLIGYVCQKGNNVNIILPIIFKGQYTQDQIASMISGIDSAWNGEFGQYNVQMTALAVSSSFDMKANTVDVIQGGGQSETVDGTNGYWYTNGYYINGLDYAHEAGHLLGLHDEGAANSLMGNVSVGAPNQSEIQAVLNSKNNRCGCG